MRRKRIAAILALTILFSPAGRFQEEDEGPRKQGLELTTAANQLESRSKCNGKQVEVVARPVGGWLDGTQVVLTQCWELVLRRGLCD